MTLSDVRTVLFSSNTGIKCVINTLVYNIKNKLAPYGTDGRLFTNDVIAFLPTS